MPPTDMFLEPPAPAGTSARGDAQFRSWKARSNCRAAAMPPPWVCAEAIPISFFTPQSLGVAILVESVLDIHFIGTGLVFFCQMPI